MTLFGRDWSDFDSGDAMSNYTWITHKATEGTGICHARLAERLNAARAAGVPVLGAYHVVRSPGNGGAGSVAAQVAYYLAYLDAQVPWWRNWPHWLHQVDLEVWAYDSVSAATGKAFANALKAADPKHLVVTYASRGEYGNALGGWPTPLWNADYRGSNSGSYPGDGWTSSGGSVAGWAPIAGQTPLFLQFADRPYDLDACRLTLDQLLTLTGGAVPAELDLHQFASYLMKGSDADGYPARWPATADLQDLAVHNLTSIHQGVQGLVADAAADATRDAAMLAAIQALSSGGTSVDTAAVINAIKAATAAESQAVAALQAEVTDLRTKLAAALSAAGQNLATG